MVRGGGVVNRLHVRRPARRVHKMPFSLAAGKIKTDVAKKKASDW